jgi:hypothetical protein
LRRICRVSSGADVVAAYPFQSPVTADILLDERRR